MTTKQQDSESRDESRVPLACAVGVRYRLFQDFIQEVSANISAGGMFIATSLPHEPGEKFDFELSLEDGFSLVKGRAEVVWTRRESPGLNHPAGMGVRFLDLEGASRTLIAKMVDSHRKKGRTPFDLEIEATRQVEARPQQASSLDIDEEVLKALLTDPPAPADEQENSMATQRTADGSPRAPRFMLLSLIAIFAGLLIVLFFNYLYVRPRIDDLERRIEGLSPQASGPGRDFAAGDGGEHVTITEEPELNPAEALAAVKGWARAWSEQRTEDYLATYSERFEPTGEFTRLEWERLRRARIGSGADIDVQVLLAEETELGPEERVVSFVQAYRSETYHDRVRKVLRLIWEDGSWKIVEERVVRSLPD